MCRTEHASQPSQLPGIHPAAHYRGPGQVPLHAFTAPPIPAVDTHIHNEWRSAECAPKPSSGDAGLRPRWLGTTPRTPPQAEQSKPSSAKLGSFRQNPPTPPPAARYYERGIKAYRIAGIQFAVAFATLLLGRYARRHPVRTAGLRWRG